METIEIYSAAPYIIPGATNTPSRKMRKIFAEEIIRASNQYHVTFSEGEEKIIYEFIQNNRTGMSFTLHFVNSNKFVDVTIIEDLGNHTWSFHVVKENFILAGGVCEEV